MKSIDRETSENFTSVSRITSEDWKTKPSRVYIFLKEMTDNLKVYDMALILMGEGSWASINRT